MYSSFFVPLFLCVYRIVGNFRGVLNFVIFVVHYEVTKISAHILFFSHTCVCACTASLRPASQLKNASFRWYKRSSRRFCGGTMNKLPSLPLSLSFPPSLSPSLPPSLPPSLSMYPFPLPPSIPFSPSLSVTLFLSLSLLSLSLTQSPVMPVSGADSEARLP